MFFDFYVGLPQASPDPLGHPAEGDQERIIDNKSFWKCNPAWEVLHCYLFSYLLIGICVI